VTEQALRSVAVRELCAFTAKRGDLDLRFTPSPTAEQGIEGQHRRANQSNCLFVGIRASAFLGLMAKIYETREGPHLVLSGGS